MNQTDFNPLQKPYIVFVDDDEEDREFIHESFQRLKWDSHVSTLKDADELFDDLDKRSKNGSYPSLIVLDSNLPGIGGDTALFMIKNDKRFKEIPVMVLSGIMDEKKKKELEILGAEATFRKPSTLAEYDALMSELRKFTEAAKR